MSEHINDSPIHSLSEGLRNTGLGDELRRRVSSINQVPKDEPTSLDTTLDTLKDTLIAREYNLNARNINKNLAGAFDVMQGLYDVKSGKEIRNFPRFPGTMWYLVDGELGRLCDALGITHDDLPRNVKIDRILMVAGVSMEVINQVRTIEEAYAFSA
ncbi:hypothetical protein CDD82_7543 [Ophiocordyceps australis]|uniref:Uncharacterized protein n=1 Tax=Ophiocordyceps australis TaxID=1399860 RepID=A0A2C5YQZ7_9HYPO|nr:hypothetical protein CDD82_7543 [Ophiocordyceps australis]